MVFRRLFLVMKGFLYALVFSLSKGLCVRINSFGSIHPYCYCLLQSPSLFLRRFFVLDVFVFVFCGGEGQEEGKQKAKGRGILSALGEILSDAYYITMRMRVFSLTYHVMF